ncbi:hypothetical protein ACJMK2_044640 [Sinanodonta woodiana]|uniref:Uncharacterized protein n=1 Tax=Sinanodonta woodiana TaxID=1069815 RepID=A0ABD3W2J1_SINWO
MAEKHGLLMLPALGLPFALGTLYNANQNQIIPAIALWEDKKVYERINITHNTDVTTSDSLDSKMDYLDVRGNLKIRALANTLEAEGSGAYLKQTKTSNRQARIIFETSGTTKDVFLSEKDFLQENVDYEWIRKSGATHVVVRITYGYQFFLMLEKICKSEKEQIKTKGQLNVDIANALLQIKGAAEGSHELKEKSMLEKCNAIIYGNVQIISNPVSIEEAIGTYKIIPELVKGRECPMTVYLLPLATICSFIPTLSIHINEALLNCVTTIFEDICNSEMALSDIKTSYIASREPRLQRKSKTLSNIVHEHKLWLQTKLHNIISDPNTEENSSEAEQIRMVLDLHDRSPFSTKILAKYVSKLEKEVHFMENLVRMLTFRYDSGSCGNENNMQDGEGGRHGIAVNILSDDIELLIPSDRPKASVFEMPIIMEEDELLNEMKSYDPDTIYRRVRHNVESLTLPFEDTLIQKKILTCAKEFVKLQHSCDNVANKIPNTFLCVFKAYERGKDPIILTV